MITGSVNFHSWKVDHKNLHLKYVNVHSSDVKPSDKRWGNFAQGVLQSGPNPRNGRKSDEAHPPIHPLKNGNGLNGDEAKLFEFITRRFLATVSRDAQGFESVCKLTIAEETFTAKGLVVTDQGYLEVYPYEKWSDKTLPEYRLHETFNPDSIDLNEGSTSAPGRA